MNDILNCQERITSSKMPLQKKVVYAYLDSLENSTQIKQMMAYLKKQSTLSQSFWLPLSLSKYSNNYMSMAYQSLIAYSLKKKNQTLFDILSFKFFTGDVYLMSSEDFLSFNITMTDKSDVFGKTDMGIKTDAETGFIYEIFVNNYVTGDTEIDNIQTYNEMENQLDSIKNLVAIIKPARVHVLYCATPYCKLGSSTIAQTTEYNTNQTITSSPFTDQALKQSLAQIALTYKDTLWDTVSSDNTTVAVTENSRTVTQTENAIVIKQTISQASTQTTYWSDSIKLSSSSSGLTDYDVTMSVENAVDTGTMTMFATISIYIPLV